MGSRGLARTQPAVAGGAGRQVSTHDRLQTLQLVATKIVGSLDFDATLLSISNAAVDVLSADMVGIMSAEDDRLKMITCAGNRNIAAARFEARRGEGVAGIVFETGSSFRLDDFRSARSISPHIRDIAEKEGIRAALGAPMLANGQVIGAVLAWSSHPAAFDEEDEEVLAGLANLAAIAIQNARLYESAREAADRLELANKALRQQYDVLERATAMQTELTQLVLDGGGLPALVDMVARYTGGDVAVLYAELEPLAVTADCDDALLTQAREQVAALRRNRRIGADGRAGDGSVLIICEVSSGEEPMAYLCVRLDRPPTELTQLITQQAAVVCALELTKQRAVVDARTQVRSDFLWDLLEGKVADVAEATLRSRHLGHTLPRKLRVMLIDIGGLEFWAHAAGGAADLVDRRRSALLAEIERLAAQTGPARVLSARRASALVLIVPGLEDVRDARKFATRLVSGIAADAPELRFSAGADEQTTELSEDAPGWLFYTSGTTGRPKGAVITHRNLVFVVVSWCADLYCLRTADVVLHCAPLSHGAGFHALTAVARGAQNLVHDRFDPDQVIGDIARYRVTTSWLVPTQVRMLLDSPALARADLSSVRALVYGGAPMHLVDLTEAMTQFGPVLCQLYGQGESPMTISYLSGDEHRLGRVDQEVLSSAGVVRTGMEIRIVDAQATSLPVGEVGEITVRGPAVMTGYWNRPDATAAALRAGWLHTGDLGRLDERGHLYVLDRLKDFVITGGSNVYAREVEDLLLRHSAIREAAVFGVPDRLWGEAVTAAVVGVDGLTPDEVIAFCRGIMADYKCPKHVHICPELPKNEYGKVLKRELRKRYADG